MKFSDFKLLATSPDGTKFASVQQRMGFGPWKKTVTRYICNPPRLYYWYDIETGEELSDEINGLHRAAIAVDLIQTLEHSPDEIKGIPMGFVQRRKMAAR